MSTGVGRYWVRPAGIPLRVRMHRIDAAAPDVEMVEEGPASFGFFFGGPANPTEGCWEVTASAGESRVSFVTAVRDTIQAFVDRGGSRVAWSAETGRLEDGDARVVVTAVIYERPGSFTGRIAGVRITLRDAIGVVTLHEEVARLHGTGALLDSLAVGGGRMIYGLGRTFNVRADGQSLAFVGEGREIRLPNRSSQDFARLLVAARRDLAAAVVAPQ
jgi:hypothetical protein